jgi:hypothetical protein
MLRVLGGLIAAGIFAYLCKDAGERLREAYPSWWICAEDPEKHEGKPIWLTPSPVTSVGRGYFEVNHYGDRIRIYALSQPNPGDHAMVHGRFQLDRSVEAVSWAADNAYPLKRKGVLIVSFLALAGVAFLFLRTFTWREGGLRPR